MNFIKEVENKLQCFSLFTATTFYKVTVNTELANTKLRIPGEIQN